MHYLLQTITIGYFSVVLFALSTVVAFANNPKAFNIEIASPTPFRSIEDVILAILAVVRTISIPIIAGFIIYAGFLYVTARGNAQQVEQATRQLTYAILGAILILGSIVLAGIIRQLVGDFQ